MGKQERLNTKVILYVYDLNSRTKETTGLPCPIVLILGAATGLQL